MLANDLEPANDPERRPIIIPGPEVIPAKDTVKN